MNVEELLSEAELNAVKIELARAKATAQIMKPDLVVQFGNDHNSGFSLRLMPPFLIALRAKALGDFYTSQGEILVNETLGRALARHLHESGIDIATSYDALLDHGFTMALDKLFSGIGTCPTIPVFTNCGGDLRPPVRRSRALGEAVGRYFRKYHPDLKVLYLGSGGLSHDPPLPQFENSAPEVQERMISGATWTPESLAQRTRWVTETGREHGEGGGNLRSLNPDWDRWILKCLTDGDLEAIANLDDGAVIQMGGRGASEVRNWLAAFAALEAHGGGTYHLEHQFYRALPSWIMGFALVHARTERSAEMEAT
ncbi:MAG: hypothetical protein K2P94_03355 [Rhodospirillaceae bacterium]|nr:hypothetical protein [Rhodospirillaceae bacterium]